MREVDREVKERSQEKGKRRRYRRKAQKSMRLKKRFVAQERVRAKQMRTKLERWLMRRLIERYKKKSLSDDKRRIKKLTL
ncbi:MAG: hypothetical protein D6780_04710 [Candidatus Dadabacteria bacterium]|nr:MAG: hypothetical protein D6780_04710 [Candidatus Dadabacteria bacterium]